MPHTSDFNRCWPLQQPSLGGDICSLPAEESLTECTNTFGFDDTTVSNALRERELCRHSSTVLAEQSDLPRAAQLLQRVLPSYIPPTLSTTRLG